MNIWYLSAYDQPRGQSPRTFEYARALSDRGHAVTMFTNNYCHFTNRDRMDRTEPFWVEECSGVKVVWINAFKYRGSGFGRGINMIENAFLARRASKTLGERPDVVIGPSVPMGTGWMACRIATEFGSKFIYEVRDVWPEALVANGSISPYSPVRPILQMIDKFLIQRAAKISSVLPNLQSHVETRGGLAERIVYLPNGIDLSEYPHSEWDGGGHETPLSVMYVGGFSPGHDVKSIILAAKMLNESGDSRFSFVIVGDGPGKAECLALAKSLNVGNIEFRPVVPRYSIAECQQHADVLIAAVVESEAFKWGLNLNKIASYLASGRPIVFSVSTSDDPVTAANAGVRVPAERPDMIVEALNDLANMTPAQRVQLGARGRAYVKMHLDINVLGERMESMLLAACGEAA